MTLELLYLEGCPNHDATVNLVRSVLEAEGVPTDFRQIAVRSREDAEALDFPGSPTVRVNGQDIERSSSNRLGIGLACRTYLVEGKVQGVPPRPWLEKTIRAARKQEDHR